MRRYSYRNINYEYLQLSDRKYVIKHEDDDEIFEELATEKILVNNDKNQSIIFTYYRFSDEAEIEDVAYIPDDISYEAYEYICNILNNKENITVIWSQVPDTTSDYTIIYNECFKSYDDVTEYLKKCDNNNSNYKYTEYINYKSYKCNC